MTEENLDFLVYELQSEQSSDRIQIAYLSQILADWMLHHTGEPLHLTRAAYEYKKHREHYAIQHLKDEREREKRKQAEANDLFEGCRTFGEPCFEIVFSDKDVEKIVTWDETIKDPVTHDKLGSVRDLIRAAWVRPKLDPRDTSQQSAYLAEIRRLFENHRTPISHSRRFEPRMFIEKAPFKPKVDRVYAAILTMRWKQTL